MRTNYLQNDDHSFVLIVFPLFYAVHVNATVSKDRITNRKLRLRTDRSQVQVAWSLPPVCSTPPVCPRGLYFVDGGSSSIMCLDAKDEKKK